MSVSVVVALIPKLRAAIYERTIDLEFALDAFTALTG